MENFKYEELTEDQKKEIEAKLQEEAKKKQTAADDTRVVPLRDLKDFGELITSLTIKQFEELNKNRDVRKVLPQESDDAATKDLKMGQLIRSILIGSWDGYKDAYNHFASKRPASKIDEKAFSTTDSSMGYGIPPDVRLDMLTLMNQYGTGRRNWDMGTTVSDAVDINGILTSVSVGYGVENTANAGTTGTQERKTATVAEMRAILGPFSSQSVADAPGLYQKWIDIMALGFTQMEDDMGFNGDGTSTYGGFTGLLKETTANCGVTEKTCPVATSGDIYGSLRSALAAVPQKFRLGGKWFIGSDFEQVLSTVVVPGTTQLMITNPTAENPGVLLGYPYEVVEVFPALSDVASGSGFGLFGNLKLSAHFWDREQMTMFVGREGTVDSVSMFAANQIAVRVSERHAFIAYLPRTADIKGSSNVSRKGLVRLVAP